MTGVWQDVVMATVQAGLAGAMIPAAIVGPRPPLFTSAPTFLGLAILAFCLGTLGLVAASVAALLSAALWGVCVFFRYRELKTGELEPEHDDSNTFYASSDWLPSFIPRTGTMHFRKGR